MIFVVTFVFEIIFLALKVLRYIFESSGKFTSKRKFSIETTDIIVSFAWVILLLILNRDVIYSIIELPK